MSGNEPPSKPIERKRRPRKLEDAAPQIVGEIRPGDPDTWQPGSIEEWAERERTRTFLAAWAEQMAHERQLRSLSAKLIFVLVAGQTVGVFAILIASGAGWLTLDPVALRMLLPTVLAEIFGLGYLVAKYLFSQPIRHALDILATGARSPPRP